MFSEYSERSERFLAERECQRLLQSNKTQMEERSIFTRKKEIKHAKIVEFCGFLLILIPKKYNFKDLSENCQNWLSKLFYSSLIEYIC